MLSLRLVPVLLIAVLFSSAARLTSAQENTTTTISLAVPGGGCVGHAWGQNGNKVDYSLLLVGLAVSNACNATANVRISKIYVEGSCASTRDNSLALDHPGDLTCSDKVSNVDDTTICHDVLGSASDNWVSAGSIAPGGPNSAGVVDLDSICAANAKDEFTFVQNNCTEAVNVTLEYTLSAYSGGTCLVVAGHALSKGVIIVIVVAALVALVLLAVLIKCCCFCL